MRILVLGGYGLIGAVVTRQLAQAGHAVIGLGRDVMEARRRAPDVGWIAADLARLGTPEAWAPVLREARADAIVNCAGALQDGMRDDVAAVQATAMRALHVAVAAGIKRFVQISATRADTAAGTTFMRSKGEADVALAACPFDWVILRPGLVLAGEAYGGTALLRALAAVPLVQPMAYADAPVQTVGVDDVAAAVVRCIDGDVPLRRTYDLVEEQAHTLAAIVTRLRAWHGLPPALMVPVPRALLRAVGRVADLLGWLGWRSPLRTTALDEIEAGVVGDPRPWRAVNGGPLASLEETLRRLPSTIQERWFARAFLVKPLAIAMLSAFWIASGCVAWFEFDAATKVLVDHGISPPQAGGVVSLGVMVDIMLGLAILVRRMMRWAAGGMVLATLGYLAGGTLIAPDLWLDPLGSFVKTLPAAMLAIVVLALADDR